MLTPDGGGFTQQQILREIELKTGLRFEQVGAIDTHDKAIAEAVLPVLAELVPSVEAPNLRAAIFHRFLSHSESYIERMVDWWESEKDEISSSFLIQAIVRVAKPRDADWLWRLAQRSPPRAFHFMLLAKLATFPRVADEVKRTVAGQLERGNVPQWELAFVAESDDLRIRRWFARQLDSSVSVRRNPVMLRSGCQPSEPE